MLQPASRGASRGDLRKAAGRSRVTSLGEEEVVHKEPLAEALEAQQVAVKPRALKTTELSMTGGQGPPGMSRLQSLDELGGGKGAEAEKG